jgi:hypothetical protein
MVTLSGAQTLADLPKMTTGTNPMPMGTMPAGTMPGRTGPTGTRSAADEATVMERIGGATMPGGIAPGGTRPGTTRPGSDDATVMERLDAPSMAAPTTQESKVRWSEGPGAEATVLERMQPMSAAAPKKNMGLYAGLAAAVVIAVLAGVYFMTRKTDTPTVATTTAAPASTQVTTTAAPSNAPVPAGQGLLLLSASPWGDLEKIVDSNGQKEVTLTEELRSTPARIPLDPGRYTVTVSGPKGTKTIDVRIEAGKRTPHNIDMGSVDYDALAKEIQQ